MGFTKKTCWVLGDEPGFLKAVISIMFVPSVVWILGVKAYENLILFAVFHISDTVATPDAAANKAKQHKLEKHAVLLVLDVPHSSPSQPLLRELHWLPIESRIKFKLCVLIYRVSRGTAPLYLCELCKPCTDSRLRSKLGLLRSSDFSNRLIVSKRSD